MGPDTISPDETWDRLFIDGDWRDAGGETIPVENPATREQFASVPAATAEDVDDAFEAAADAQPGWAALSRAKRLEHVERLRDLLQENFQQIVRLLAVEAGSTQHKATGEVGISLSDFDTALDLEPPEPAVRDSVFVDDKRHNIVYEPVGVVSIISPWNYPLHLTTRALAPALALGNTAVIKPATDTPIVGGLVLAKLAAEAGLPDGVLNVVTGKGSEIGDRVAGHPVPRVLAFTGSTGVGRAVAGQAGENLTMPTLELGGNGPFLVTADVDVDQAARIGAVGSFTHQGQVCISINRHLVHEEVYDEYVTQLVDHAEAFTIGDPTDPATDFGPVINEGHREDVLEFIRTTIDQGATLETGGGADDLFVEPTVLSEVENDMAAACNEHFGPVAPVIPITSGDHGIELANDTEYGLAASLCCNDLERARELAGRIEAGMVHINDHPIQDEPNAPFGGTKDSGLGRYNGEWVMEKLLEPKWISVQHETREYDFL